MPDQLSLFSVAARTPSYDDLAGLLIGPGQVVRRGRAARVSVVVADDWRVRVLRDALAVLELDSDVVPVRGGAGGQVVRTPFIDELLPLAQAWTRGAVKTPPARFGLDGVRLWWWAVAAGERAAAGYVLHVGAADSATWEPAGAALSAVGLPATFVGPRAAGPAYRLLGARRLARLREFVGDPPEQAPDGVWVPAGRRAGPAS